MRFSVFLAGLGIALSTSIALAEPEAFRGLEQDAYRLLDRATFSVREDGKLVIPVGGQAMTLDVILSHFHSNGDRSLTASTPDGGHAQLTLGRNSAFGHVLMDGKRWQLTTDAQGIWMVEIPDRGVSYNQCGFDHELQKTKRQIGAQPGVADSGVRSLPGTVIDLLIIYNQAFANRYPGDLLQTRLNHLLNLANQAMPNSGIELGFRVVGVELFDYSNTNSNREALFDMNDTLSGDEQPGLEGLAALRDSLGADLVTMHRPHDIEKRGSCGIAFLPGPNPSYGVNVNSDGMSSWSVCTDDVMTHEIGHNLGATHQVGNGLGGGEFDPRGAAITRPGVLTTMMGSFGTGHADRFRGVAMFSTPLLDCGGQACGRASNADNAVVIRGIMPQVESYRPAISSQPLPDSLPRANPDSDGDGISDWDDLLPFDPGEQHDTDLDSAGDFADAFPDDETEQLDTDEDGVGNNVDQDDDGDTVDDGQDAFPLDAAKTEDEDSDGVGSNADVFPDSEAEFRDFDDDGTGNNADSDDDGDGVNELDSQAEDILVISVGNNRILRFDAASGESRGVEVPPSDGLLTFQSDLVYRPADHTVLYLSDSSIKRVDLMDRQLKGIWVPAFDDDNPGVAKLSGGFPTSLELLSNGARIGATKMNATDIIAFNGREMAFEDNSLNWILSQPDNPIDMVALGPGAVILGQTSKTLYLADAQNVFTLAGPGAPWMKDPYRMALSGDGRVLISDQKRHSVVAVNAVTGDFLGDFADLDAAGYRNPTGIAVTRDGELLVASAGQNAILAFDAATGEFLDERVASGSWGLKKPYAMILVPQLLDRINDDPDRIIRPNPGLWYNPATDGRGFDIEIYGQRLTAIWYTYDQQGLPLWYFSSGVLEGFEYSGDILLFALDNEGSSSFEIVGELALSFESERRAQMSFSIGAVVGGEPLQWLPASVEPADPDFTGLWGRADGPGWGLSLATQGKITTAIAFLYDQGGQPRWVISDPTSGNGPLMFNMNAVFSPTLCPRCSGEPNTEFKPAGTMEVDPQGNMTWSSDILFPQPLDGDWILDETPVILFSDPTSPNR